VPSAAMMSCPPGTFTSPPSSGVTVIAVVANAIGKRRRMWTVSSARMPVRRKWPRLLCVRTEVEFAKTIVAAGPVSGGTGSERFGGDTGGIGNDGMGFACQARFGGGVGTGMGAAPEDGVGRTEGCGASGGGGGGSPAALAAPIENKNKPTRKASPER